MKKLALFLFINLLLNIPIFAQNDNPSLRNQKEQELNAVLHSKDKTMTDIAKFIPYDLPIVNRSFYVWTKKKLVFYTDSAGKQIAILPENMNENIKVDFESQLSIHPSENYYKAWRDYFEQHCYAQGEGEVVMKRYFNGKIDFKTCLAKLQNSENINGCIPYLREFVFTAVKQDQSNWQPLYQLYTNLPPKSTKTKMCLGAMLCRTTGNIKNWVSVMEVFPPIKTFYYGGGDEEFKNDADILSGKTPVPLRSEDKYGNCLSGIILYPDGRIIMRRTENYCPFGERLQSQLSVLDETEKYYHGQGYTFLYNPKGKCYLGLLKSEGTLDAEGVLSAPAVWNNEKRYVPGDAYDLAAGFELNNKGEVLKESYFGRSTASEARNSIDKLLSYERNYDNNKKQQAIDKAYDNYYKKLVNKYGAKAAKSIINFEVYVGMPERLIKDYIFYSPDTGNGMKVFLRLNISTGGAAYCYRQVFRQIIGGNTRHCVIYCRNGRVVYIDYNYPLQLP